MLTEEEIYDCLYNTFDDIVLSIDSNMTKELTAAINKKLHSQLTKERIICSAVHVHTNMKHKGQPNGIKEGFVVAGRRHGDCYTTIKLLITVCGAVLGNGLVEEYQINGILAMTKTKDMGFLTNTNRFVGRKEALKIAIEADQLLNPVLHEGKKYEDDMYILTSEDLFLDIE